MTPLTTRLHEILADGEWHDREPIVKELMRLAPPGEAWRMAEEVRVRSRIRRARNQLTAEAFAAWMEAGNHELNPRPKSMEATVQTGKRAMANSAIGMRATNRIEQRIVDGKKQIRLRPLDPFYSQSRSRALRDDWIRVNGEPKDDNDRLLLKRFVHRELAREQKERKAREQSHQTDNN